MPPLEPPVEPMLARLVRALPAAGDHVYEPKWDGFRCLAFRRGQDVDLRSRNQRPLARYFPEVVEGIRALAPPEVVMDGELLVVHGGRFDFSALMSRLHPAPARVALLARDTPALLVVFDLLAVDGDVLVTRPFEERRRRLESTLRNASPPVLLSPATRDRTLAEQWLARFGGSGIDGVVVKDLGAPYEPGRRTMTKVKLERTADCVVAGFRWLGGGRVVSSLLLGLYEESRGRDTLRHVGVVSSFTDRMRAELAAELAPHAAPLAGHPWEHGYALEGGPTGRLKGAAGRWTPDQLQDWVPLAPERVCEVAYDQVDAGRFRHAPRWRRWRPDRDPASCRIEQLEHPAVDAAAVLAP